jgi:hypothetical protein
MPRALLAESAPAPGDSCGFLRQELQHHASTEALIFGLVGDSHSTATEVCHDTEMRNRLTKHVGANGRRWTEANQFLV